MSITEAKNRQLSPLGKIVATTSTGVEPLVMGLGPVSAIESVVSCSDFHCHDPNLKGRTGVKGSGPRRRTSCFQGPLFFNLKKIVKFLGKLRLIS